MSNPVKYMKNDILQLVLDLYENPTLSRGNIQMFFEKIGSFIDNVFLSFLKDQFKIIFRHDDENILLKIIIF